MHSLYARLSLALLVLVLAIGGGFFLIEQWSSQRYYEELTQRLNAPIAMYVTDQALLIKEGQVNEVQMARLAEQAMVINPSLEVYLLNPYGHILSHRLPAEEVQLESVDMAPIKALIHAPETMPVRGSDPRNPAREKIFSVFPVMDADQLQGYLYVVLGGQKYDQLASRIRGSYVGTVTFSAIIALIGAAFFVGLLVFALLTRRLTRLTNAVQIFTDGNFEAQSGQEIGFFRRQDATDHQPDNKHHRDEIDRLSTAVACMANKIEEQFHGLKETDRLRRELISNVSHDLRTPLASMLGYVDTLLLKNDQLNGAERSQYLTVVRKHTQHLGALIGDLFELSKLEADSVRLSMETFPLAELLQDVCQEFSLEAAQRDIHIDLTKNGSSVLVCADIALVQRVLENLLRNAFNFTADGGRITLSLKTHADKVVVSVADTGCGIAADKLESIFERFYSSASPEAINNAISSTGLGLAIVKRILDLHGCDISVSSIVDKGSCFKFDLPVSPTA